MSRTITLTLFFPDISCTIYYHPLSLPFHHFHYIHICLRHCTGGQVPNDLHHWDYPVFRIFHFILFLYTRTDVDDDIGIDIEEGAMAEVEALVRELVIFYLKIYKR